MNMGTISITLTGLTPATAKKIWDTIGDTTTTTKTRRTRGKPEATITDEDEEEMDEISVRDLGKKSKKRAKATDEDEEEVADEESEEEEETEAESDEESEEDSEDEEEEDQEKPVTFSQVKKEIDRYGETKPKAMKALLKSFNLSSTAELKTNKKKWAPVLKKILATFKK